MRACKGGVQEQQGAPVDDGKAAGLAGGGGPLGHDDVVQALAAGGGGRRGARGAEPEATARQQPGARAIAFQSRQAHCSITPRPPRTATSASRELPRQLHENCKRIVKSMARSASQDLLVHHLPELPRQLHESCWVIATRIARSASPGCYFIVNSVVRSKTRDTASSSSPEGQRHRHQDSEISVTSTARSASPCIQQTPKPTSHGGHGLPASASAVAASPNLCCVAVHWT